MPGAVAKLNRSETRLVHLLRIFALLFLGAAILYGGGPYFTRGSDQPIVTEPTDQAIEPAATAGQVLANILDEGILRGTSTYIRSGDPCVCFTEAPLSEFSTRLAVSLDIFGYEQNSYAEAH